MADDVSGLNAADSAAMLVSMSAAYAAANALEREPTPAEAAQRLGEMTRAYHEAHKPAHTAADEALVGAIKPEGFTETITFPGISTSDKLGVIDRLRQLDFSDKNIGTIISGEAFDQASVDQARAWKARAFSDPELRKLILNGDPDAKRMLIAASAIIAAGVKQQ